MVMTEGSFSQCGVLLVLFEERAWMSYLALAQKRTLLGYESKASTTIGTDVL